MSKVKEFTALVYLPTETENEHPFDQECYALTQEAYYLICRLQQVGYKMKMTFDCEPHALKDIKFKLRHEMYTEVLKWLVEHGEAIRFEHKPVTLLLKLEE
jgi:hypothetical protein